METENIEKSERAMKPVEVIQRRSEESKFNVGEIVFDMTRPSQPLVVVRHVHNLYYCKPKEYPSQKDLVFFEWDLNKERK